MSPDSPRQRPPEVSGLARAAYGVLEIRDIDADVSDDDAMLRAGETIAASGGYHVYLRSAQQGLDVRITVRLSEPSTPVGSPGEAPATPPEGWDGERRHLPLELESGHLVVMQLTLGPALEWDVPGGGGRFSVDVRYRNRELAADRYSALSTRMVEEDWPIDRALQEAQAYAGLEEYQLDLHRLPESQ
jgi:hypothetical protein